MNKAEKKIYARERALIRRHFNGLKPRPIKIVKSMKHLGEADETFLKLQQKWLAERHTETELNKLLLHELIHYQLRDEGRFSGHGREFRRRASLLGCEKIAGGCSHADYSYYGDEEKAGGEAERALGAGDVDLARFQWLSEALQDIPVKLRQLIEKEHPVMRQGRLSRLRDCATADQGHGHRYRVAGGGGSVTRGISTGNCNIGLV